jgi:hypothetical protein
MRWAQAAEILRADPRTTWLAVACTALGIAGETLQHLGIHPWGTVLVGAAGLVGGISLVFARLPSKSE